MHNEIAAGRRVFIDFTSNPTPAADMDNFSIPGLKDEARTYLERSGALQATPLERLRHMNPASIHLYNEQGIDLNEPLEVAVCAQHCNGGLRGNTWWETNIPHLFAIGELNGTHGVRPGGSALNSGQVGAVRAAQYIANVYKSAPPTPDSFKQQAEEQVAEQFKEYRAWLATDSSALDLENIRPVIQEHMTRSGAFIRNLDDVEKSLREAKELYRRIREHGISCKDRRALTRASEDKLMALTSIAFLEAIKYYIEHGGGSRGGYMILDDNGDLTVESKRGRELRHRSENLEKRQEILEIQQLPDSPGDFAIEPIPPRPLPRDESWYETAWADWNEGRIFTDGSKV